ncbi:unnamed protein product [Auanema sp. JU1783]|nr:unnamed protein product [Auanema sp. JU1783]
MSKEELCEDFRSITGCRNSQEINQYLEACSYDLPTAVDLFFARDALAGSSEGDPPLVNDEPMTCDDDPHVVQQRKVPPIKAKANGKCNNRSNNLPPVCMEPEVRPPMQFSRGALVQQTFNQQYGSRTRVHSAFNNEVRDYRQEALEQERSLRRAQNGLAFEANNASVDLRGNNRSTNTLSFLFRPPVDIMFSGTWETVKSMASRAEKWLLVNIQNYKFFACEELNRDVWSNSAVKELVKTNFIFYQISHDSSDGERVCNYYRVTSFPSLFIVDPRTGELVTTILLNQQDPVTFCDSLTTFLDQFPDLATRDRFIIGGRMFGAEPDAFGPGYNPNAAAEPECSRSVAMEDDMEPGPKITRKRKPKEEDGVTTNKKCKPMAKDDVEELLNHDTKSLSVVDKDDWLKEVSPTGSPCRIRLKLPDGRLHTLEITDESKLKALISCINGLGISGHDHVFILSFPRREYSIDHSECTLKSLGFTRNEMVHVELK